MSSLSLSLSLHRGEEGERLTQPLLGHLGTRHFPLSALNPERMLAHPVSCPPTFIKGTFLLHIFWVFQWGVHHEEPDHPTPAWSALASLPFSWFCLYKGLSQVMESSMTQVLIVHPARYPIGFVESWKLSSLNQPCNETQRGRIMVGEDSRNTEQMWRVQKMIPRPVIASAQCIDCGGLEFQN